MRSRHVFQKFLRENAGEFIGIGKERLISNLLSIDSYSFGSVYRIKSALFCVAV